MSSKNAKLGHPLLNMEDQKISATISPIIPLVLSKMVLGVVEVGIKHLGRNSKAREHLNAKVTKVVMTAKDSAHQDQQSRVDGSHDNNRTDSI